MVSRERVSKTQLVYRTNLNFKLIRRYLFFLTGEGYLRVEQFGAFTQLGLTAKGEHLRAALNELENEISGFWAIPQWQDGEKILQRREREGGGRNGQESYRFMQTLNSNSYRELNQIANKAGVTVQEFLRGVIIPKYLKQNLGT